MLRLVLDTNVVLDLLHFDDPASAPIRQAQREGRVVCCVNAACRDELAHVLSYPQFKIPEHEARRILDEYDALAQPCHLAADATLPPLPQCRDPDDQKFLELARAAKADLLVTKDKALLALARKVGRLGLQILTPAQAVARMNRIADERAVEPGPEAEVVVLVHGLWLGGWVCSLLGHWLRASGFRVVRFGYPSTREALSANAARLARFAQSLDVRTVHFVGHSLGGLVALMSQIDHPDRRPGRMVMLGSPFGGSQAAARLGTRYLGRALLGRSLRDWMADRPDAWTGPRQLGVIAGSGRIGMGRFIAPDLTRPNDGVVTVEETRVPGATDHIVLPVSHTEMLASRRVAGEAARFLLHGRFRHDGT